MVDKFLEGMFCGFKISCYLCSIAC